jgi:hypothetical protein
MPNIIPTKIEQILRMVSLDLRKQNETILLDIIVNSKYYIEEETSYDNWNGGINGHTIHFELPEALFIKIISQKEKYEKTLSERLNKLGLLAIEWNDCVKCHV